jgi:predicted metal-dependent phosphoesterase TrpH
MWLKVDLHLHTNEGPEGFVRWTPGELVDLAARAGYQVLSFTDHDRVTYSPGLARYARDRGIVLIPGVEATVEGRHVLLYNFASPPEALRTFADIRRHKSSNTLVVAPHPFYPGPTSLRRRLLQHLDLFDAVEYSHFYTSWLNGNHRALRLTQEHGFPLLGGSDAHLPRQFGTTYSLVDADLNPEGVVSAIRAGRVRVVSRPLATYALCTIGLALMGGTIIHVSWGWIGTLRHAILSRWACAFEARSLEDVPSKIDHSEWPPQGASDGFSSQDRPANRKDRNAETVPAFSVQPSRNPGINLAELPPPRGRSS